MRGFLVELNIEDIFFFNIFVNFFNLDFFNLDFSVDLMIDTEGKIINTIGGEIKIPSDLDVKNITYGNSIIAFWVDRPILENGKIIFSGIIPGGFKGKLRSGGLSPGKILTLNLNSRNEEKKIVELENTEIYLDDGEGTLDSKINSGNFVYIFNPGLIEQMPEFVDKIPPEEFQIELIEQDKEKFLIFNTQDKESGIKYYEIKIGLDHWKKVNSPYKIRDFELKQDIQIKAIDGFGNVTMSHFKKPNQKEIPIYKFLLILLIIIILILLFLKKKKKKKFSD